jgi:hypothetical protein
VNDSSQIKDERPDLDSVKGESAYFDEADFDENRPTPALMPNRQLKTFKDIKIYLNQKEEESNVQNLK